MKTEELKRLAEAANDLDPGEWTAGNNQWVGCVLTKATLLGRDISLCVADCTTLEAAATQNAAYIAAANPAAILELIAEVDRLRDEVNGMTGTLARIETERNNQILRNHNLEIELRECRSIISRLAQEGQDAVEM